MKLMWAFFKHMWLVLRLKHDGTGMPQRIPAAMVLAAPYVVLTYVNARMSGQLSTQTIIGLSFVAQVYVFALRQKLIGLILLIGVVANLFTLTISLISVLSQDKVLMITFMEMVMILSAVINVIRHDTSAA